jgi:hypothetical protein
LLPGFTLPLNQLGLPEGAVPVPLAVKRLDTLSPGVYNAWNIENHPGVAAPEGLAEKAALR